MSGGTLLYGYHDPPAVLELYAAADGLLLEASVGGTIVAMRVPAAALIGLATAAQTTIVPVDRGLVEGSDPA